MEDKSAGQAMVETGIAMFLVLMTIIATTALIVFVVDATVISSRLTIQTQRLGAGYNHLLPDVVIMCNGCSSACSYAPCGTMVSPDFYNAVGTMLVPITTQDILNRNLLPLVLAVQRPYHYGYIVVSRDPNFQYP